MASLISGYEYDIFISYRQKDNKHDGWVTKFVENLKGELEATFKEDISVYFDENPHDRLQETHDVNRSLEGKLKCLIFIPILSQTYCDPNSYAWQYEFLAFNKFSNEDRFGKNIRLRNGNYTSRILPIRIHDLEPEDIKLFEKETGSILRAMDFVFKTTSGVNRPLKFNEDHPQDNLNKTFYSDQLNKVANTIKEIILGLKTDPTSHREEKIQQSNPLVGVFKEEKHRELDKPATFSKTMLVSGTIIILFLITIVLIYPKVFNIDKFNNIKDPNGRISIAVIPFENWSQSEEYAHLGHAIANEICTALSNIKEFNVKSFTSTSRYIGSDNPSIAQIGKELDAKIIIEGSIERQNQDVSIHIQVIQAESDDQLWAEKFEGKWQDIFSIRANITKKIAAELKTVLSANETSKIEKESTKDLEAYDYYLLGDNEHWKYWSNNNPEHINRSIEYFMKAIEEDPQYSLAYTGLGQEYWMLGHYALKPSPEYWKESKRLLKKAIELDPENAEAYAHLGVIQHNWNCDSSSARHSFEKAFSLSPNNDTYYLSSKYLEYRLGNCSKVASIIDKWSKINPDINPPSSDLMLLTCQKKFKEIRLIADKDWTYSTGIQASFYYYLSYVNNGNYDNALKIAESIEDKSDDPSVNLSIKGHILALKGDREGAMTMLLNLKKLSESRYVSNVYFANIYYALGDKERTLEYLNVALQERDWRIRAFYDVTAFNLIRKDETWLEDFIRRSWIPISDTE